MLSCKTQGGFDPLFYFGGLIVSVTTTVDRIKQLLDPIVLEGSLELVDVEFHPSGKRWLLRVYIDKEGGVSISDCEYTSRELGRILDVEDVIEHPYTLEVSSPGLTRPLKKREDFERHRGKICRIITRERLYDRNEFEGEIGAVNDDRVEIIGKLDVFTIPICAIKKAHLDFRL